MDCKVTIKGNLTRDPQLRTSSRTGEPFAVLGLAVNNRRYDRTEGRWITTGTTFFDLLCWGAMGANVLRSFTKGDPVIVHGRFRLNEWTSEKSSGINATLDVDSIGPDLSFGTATFSRGSAGYGLDRVNDYNPGEDEAHPAAAHADASNPDQDDVPGDDDSELEAYADEHGEVSDEAAEVLLARTA